MLMRVEGVAFSYHDHPVLCDVNFDLRSGEWLTIVGPNGAGKSTLLRLLLGLQKPIEGQIILDGRFLHKMSRREIATHMALLPQHPEMPFGFTVREIVSMGRTPYLGRFRPMDQNGHGIIAAALTETETEDLQNRPVTELSGGEAQRVFLARAFAQATPILALDEPTTNLDLFHERMLLEQVKKRQQNGTTIIAVLHDLNLAARYSDRILVLHNGTIAALGTPEEIFTEELIEDVFKVPLEILRDPKTQRLRILH